MGSFTVLHGRLVADPEQKTYPKQDGTTGSMTVFCVAVDARFGDQTYYYDCAAHGKTAELITAHLFKGKEVVVYGEHIYKEKDKKRYWTLNVDRFDFCGSRETNSNAPSAPTMQEVNDAFPF